MVQRDGLSTRDRALLSRLIRALEQNLHDKSRPKPLWERLATPMAVALSALGIGVTIWISQGQLNTSSEQFDRTQRASAEQFDRTQRQNQYSDIVGGMASSSVAVQVNSIRRLVQYVVEPANFATVDLQEQAAVNAAQTLAAFIQDESAVSGHEGLTDYRDPQPVVVGRALDQLFRLTDLRQDASDAGTTSFPQLAVDLTHGNFHGVPAGDISPTGSFLAVAADFRAATLTGWDLSAVPAPNLSSSFFTCANLQESDLGTADVAAADFTGANLRGADLSDVQNLTSDQLRGALTGPQTILPGDVQRPPQPGWGIVKQGDHYRPSLACRHLLDRMTNLLPGAGFSSRLACPGTPELRFQVRMSKREDKALVRTCRIRPREYAGLTDPGSG